MDEKHRTIKKNFETEMTVDRKKLPRNNFIQETIGNITSGFSNTLKGMDAKPESMKIRIKGLHKPTDVDAHVHL